MRRSGQWYLRVRSDTIDRFVAVVALILLAPVFVCLAVLVAVVDGRPALVRLVRVGKAGTPFRQLKFRTMAQDVGGASITSGADSRITELGAVLRRRRLDELPQLVNIARGEMALIGPRPETPDMVDGSGDWPHVLEAKPGIAGVTQAVFSRLEPLLLTGDDHLRIYRDEVLPAKLRVDRWYIENASPKVDLQIVKATFAAVVGEGRVSPSLERRLPGVEHLVHKAEQSS